MILQIVDKDDNVLWDLSSWPNANTEGIMTAVSPATNLGTPQTEYSIFETDH